MNKDQKYDELERIIGLTNYGNEYIWDVYIGITYWDILQFLCNNWISERFWDIRFWKYNEVLSVKDERVLDDIITIIRELEKRNNISLLNTI